jgi:bacillithiol biosynthesis cysteine-adding enzyme BshC
MYTVEYNKLPSFNNLFLDYISHSEDYSQKLSKYFFADYRESQDIVKVIETKAQNYNANRYFDKNTLIDILKRQNMAFGGNEITASNIELLKDDNTFAVVTGQQVGLYTGNLYTIFKLITAIKLANELKNKYPDYNFVPIFWLESEDHDLDEANHVFVINKQNELVRIGYESEVVEESDGARRNLKPVGSLKFDNTITEHNQKLKHSLIDTDFKESLFEKINTYYTPGNNYKSSFAGLLNWIFKDYGPVIIDCGDVEVKKLLTPVFEKELTTSPKLCESIITTSAELEHNYDLQVKPKVINLFFIHNDNRLLIEPRENNRFALRNSKRRFEHDEIMNILFENPELFSPNVVLRPICQDYLLPTVAYVGGPSEISYFAQLKAAYEHYDITMPVIYPRASVTILENKINKFLKNFNIDFTEVFHHKTLISKVADKLSEIKVEDEISKVQDEFNSIFYELKNMTAKIDKTLQNSLENVKEKLNANMELFKNKLINAQALKSDTTTVQIDKVVNNLYPDGKLQERVINVTYFLNKYNDTFIKKLFYEIDVNNFVHQVIEF